MYLLFLIVSIDAVRGRVVGSRANCQEWRLSPAFREHLAATSTALLTAGLIGGVIGYFIGVAAHHEQHVHRRWY